MLHSQSRGLFKFLMSGEGRQGGPPVPPHPSSTFPSEPDFSPDNIDSISMFQLAPPLNLLIIHVLSQASLLRDVDGIRFLAPSTPYRVSNMSKPNLPLVVP